MITTSQMTVAKEIVHQVGSQALFMLGAKDIQAVAEGLGGFCFVSKHAKVQYANEVKVVLGNDETYTLTFGRGDKATVVDNVSLKALHGTIEQHTGLTTSMEKIIIAHRLATLHNLAK